MVYYNFYETVVLFLINIDVYINEKMAMNKLMGQSGIVIFFFLILKKK